MKTNKQKLILIVSYLIIFAANFDSLKAQNEQFHGGVGDGSSVAESSPINFNEINYSGLDLTLSINQAASQTDPTENSPINFTVIFSENVTDFSSTDVIISGTASPSTAIVSGSGSNYNVAVSGMSSNGTVIINIPEGIAHNSVGNSNKSATFFDNIVSFNGQNLYVEITLAEGQINPTNEATVHFTATFSENVNDFTSSDVSFWGTANPENVSISGNGNIYDVEVSGMTNSGTVVINITENMVANVWGKQNLASINTENQINCDYVNPSLIIDYADGQENPSFSSVINFKATFSESIIGFSAEDIILSGTANPSIVNISGNNEYIIAVSGMTQSGTVIVDIPENIAVDIAGNQNTQSNNINNEVNYIDAPFTVEINQASGQNDPTNISMAAYTITFNRAPVDFDISDIVIIGNNTAQNIDLSGSDLTYTLTLSEFTSEGTIVIEIDENTILDEYLNGNQVSINTDNRITIDTHSPEFVITKGQYQNNPTNNSTINFKITLNEEVIYLNENDIVLSGTANATEIELTGSGLEYNVGIKGMSQDGNVKIAISENSFTDLAGNLNQSHESYEIYYDITRPNVEILLADGQTNPSYSLPIKFKIAFSEEITNFSDENIVYGGSENLSLSVSGIGKNYEATINGAITNETVAIFIPAWQTYDKALNPNNESINTSNSVTYLGTTSANDIDNNIIDKIYFANGNLIVELKEFPNNNSNIKVFDISGKLILAKKITDKKSNFPISIPENTIIIKLNVNNTQKSKKLIIN